MADLYGYQFRNVRCWLELPELRVTLELAKFGADFELNTIPRAVCVVALGRDTNQTGKPARIHEILDEIKIRKKALVWLELSGGSQMFPIRTPVTRSFSAADGFSQVVFDGYITGEGYERSPDGAGYTLALTHWLDDLNASSAVSGSAFPSVPSDMAFPHTLRMVTLDTAAGRLLSQGLTGESLAAVVTDPVEVPKDLWRNGIRKWFTALASSDHLADAAITGQFGKILGDGGDGRPNAEALKALRRMAPTDAPPLALRNAGSAEAAITRMIQTEIGKYTFDVMLNQTLWDVLLGLGTNFLFAVSPAVSSARIVPWLPTLKTAYATLFAADGPGGQIAGDMPRTMRGVALVTSSGFSAGGAVPVGETEAAIARSLGIGIYLPNKDGMVLVKQAPTWLAGIPAEYFLDLTKVEEAVVPTPGNPGAGVPPGDITPADILAAMDSTLNSYAKTLYGLEVLKFRTGTITSKFRTDIAPGSVVRIELPGELFVAESGDQLGRMMYGSVTAVSLSVDAEAKRCETSFGIAHLRSEAENSAGILTMNEHPLYEKTWPGASLV